MSREVFQTRLGPMEARWEGDLLSSLGLRPELGPGAPPSSPLARQVDAHFEGETQDFRDVPLALEGLSDFACRVYAAAREVPAGRVVTYGELARTVEGGQGTGSSSRAVGTALGRNPFLLVVPCHRVLASGQGMGGFSAPGGLATKALMLAAEGYGVESLWQPGQLEAGTEWLRADPRLGPVVEAVGPCTLRPLYPENPFAALARNVLYQQLAGSAARAIELRVKALGNGESFPGAQELLAMPESSLRAAGLSGPKIAALWALSRAVLEGSLPVDRLRLLPDEMVVEEVSRVKGLGSWTAEMFLMFHLGRRDLLPVKDLGIRKGFQRLFGWSELPDASRMERAARKWRPYRSLASWYLWRSLEL
jgi:O-6-methylguanine DNA methyltransferase